MQTDSIRYFYHSKYAIANSVETDPVSVNIDDFDGSQRVLLSGGLTNPTFPSQESCRHTFIHSPTSACFIFWGGGGVGVGSTHLQPYYPDSSAAARPALCCRSARWVTSASRARSAQLRSSGISPMGNLLRIQKKPVHTSNCDGALLTLSARSLDEKAVSSQPM